MSSAVPAGKGGRPAIIDGASVAVEASQTLEASHALDAHIARIRMDADWGAYLPPHSSGLRWRAARRVKRALDIAGAAAALVLLLPVLVAIAVLVRLTGRGPVLYEWRVLGERARPFIGYKFRTMVVDADARKDAVLARNEMLGPVFKMKDDPRVTRLGRWLRRYSLDELPQLWSVLRGDMSLVGPRPVYPHEFAEFESWQWGKLAVVPGLTCLWQVNGRSEIADFDRWAALDLEYIQHWNLLLDLKILLRTAPAVLRGHGAY